jgi:hypothetical protein
MGVAMLFLFLAGHYQGTLLIKPNRISSAAAKARRTAQVSREMRRVEAGKIGVGSDMCGAPELERLLKYGVTAGKESV